MKKCPNCERTFEDSMRFCQTDGTALVDDAPPVDPYKTMVATSDEIAAAMPPAADTPKPEEEVLQLPADADPKKTMFVSEEELRKEMADEQVMDLPPLAPEPPKFSEPSLSPPSFGDVTPSTPPASPFAPPEEPKSDFSSDPFQKTTPPIPSPFGEPKPSTYEPPATPSFAPAADPEPVASTSFDPPSAPIEASAPSPVQSWEPNEPMQNPVSMPQGQNKTLAIVSLVLGILGLTVCCGSILPSIVAIILGFMAKSKASGDPVNFGGGGLALGGIITGFIGILGSIALLALYFLGALASVMGGR